MRHARPRLGLCAAGDSDAIGVAASFIGNMLTSDPVRYARTEAVLEAEPELGIGSPTVAWADAAFG